MHNASMDIEFDPSKARSNLAKHQVSFAHAEQALRDPMAVTIEDPDAEGEQRFVTPLREVVADAASQDAEDKPITVATLRKVLREELHIA